jgi:hypothetical protein
MKRVATARVDGRFSNGASGTARRDWYAELKRQIHEALRSQNPQWVDANGESRICDEYDRRFAELLEAFERSAGRGGKATSTDKPNWEARLFLGR